MNKRVIFAHNIILLFFYLILEKKYVREKTIKAKNILRKYSIISEIWRRDFAPSNKIGNCTNLFRMHNPNNEEDFCNKYFEYAEKNRDLPISKRGLTYDEFRDLVNEYMSRANAASGKNYDFDTYYNDVLCHVITETYDGKLNEMQFKAFLENLGYKCSYFDGTIDGKYGVDIKVTRGDNKVSAIQIKPITFFKSKRSDVYKDRIAMIYKYHNFLKDYGYKTYYAIYEKNKTTGEIKWVKNGNGFRFKLDELFEYDINDITNTFKTKAIPDELSCL